MRTSTKVILSAAGLAAAAFTGLSFFVAHNIMHGRRQTLDEAIAWQKAHYDISWFKPLEKTEYTIRSWDDYELHVMLCRNPQPTGKYVIITHGYTDNRYGMLKYMKMYLDAGFNCIIYDLRGHGENEPTFCTYSIREAKDLHALIEDTRRRYPDLTALGLHGESLGAATTAAVLKYDQDLAFAVADCGFSEIMNVLKGSMRYSHLPEWFVWPASIAVKLRCGYYPPNMRPVDSLKDTFIVPDNSRDMQKATAGYSELYIIPDAKHANSVLTHPDLYNEYLQGFLQHCGVGQRDVRLCPTQGLSRS